MSNLAKFQLTFVVLLLVIASAFGGYYVGKRGFQFELKNNPPSVKITNASPADQTVDFALFWEVWNKVHKTYLERPVDSKKMMYGAIEGMVRSLDDPYTSYLPPQVNKSVNNSLNGKYEGIGAELSVKDNMISVVAPLDGSPAKEGGVMAGDYIIEIDGASTVGMSLTEAVSKIRGDAGTAVKLKILHTDSKEPVEINLTRRQITVDSVSWQDKGNGIAYIRISRFGEDTNTQWDKVASEVNVKMKELSSIIIDVRGNPGGYLTSAIHIGGEFFSGTPVVFQESADGTQTPFKPDQSGVFTRVPKVYVLIDGGSASASEILAAALRDTISATLVGAKSFGKGTIQNAENYDDGSGLHVTIAKWLTPKKEWVHKKGLEPDVKVERTSEDFQKNLDPQLDKAIELAKTLK